MAKRKTLVERLEQYNTGKALRLYNESRYALNTRVKKKVKQILEYENKYFITFTLQDKYLTRDKKYLMRKIKEALSQASLYIANEDYGSKNGRLHFHALASFNLQLDYTTKDNYVHSIWKYGNIDFMKIYNSNDEAITKYLTKLTNHAIKSTAGKIVYSRGFQS